MLADAGHVIVLATATAGEGGSADLTLQTGRIRQQEAHASAALAGGAYHCLGFPDLGVFNDDLSRRAVTELLRTVLPDVVITGSPADYHPDHEADQPAGAGRLLRRPGGQLPYRTCACAGS